MNKKLLLGFILGIFLISFISASLGSFDKNECVNIKTILNTSSVTLSTLSYPNGTVVLSEKVMTNAFGNTWNYTFCNTSDFGTYIYDYYDDSGNVYVNDFIIAPAYELTNSIVLFYIGTLAVLCFFFVLCLLFIGYLPSEDPIDNDGRIMAINTLKYLRYPIGGLAWGILVIISFVIFNFAEGYIVEGLILSVFRMIFQFLMISATIGIPVILYYMFAKFMQDKVIKQMIERNIFTD